MSNAIAEMDLSNLTNEQVEVLIKLVWAAENGFDLFVENAINADSNTKQADRCMVLRNRLGREKKTREQQEQNK